jgi:hypothetical protein
MSTLAPALARNAAAVRPEMPAPTMITSYFMATPFVPSWSTSLFWLQELTLRIDYQQLSIKPLHRDWTIKNA